MDVVDGRTLFLVRCHLGKGQIGIVAVEADLVVLGHDLVGIAQLACQGHGVGVMAGLAGEGVAQVLGVHRLVELALDAHGLAGMAVLAFGHFVLGVGGVGMFGIAVAVTLGTGHLTMIGCREGIQMHQVTAQFLEIHALLGWLLEPRLRMASQALGIGGTDLHELFRGGRGIVTESQRCGQQGQQRHGSTYFISEFPKHLNSPVGSQGKLSASPISTGQIAAPNCLWFD